VKSQKTLISSNFSYGNAKPSSSTFQASKGLLIQTSKDDKANQMKLKMLINRNKRRLKKFYNLLIDDIMRGFH